MVNVKLQLAASYLGLSNCFDLCVTWVIRKVVEENQKHTFVYRKQEGWGFIRGTAVLCREAPGWSKQIFNSIKCLSKGKWRLTEKGMEREWECQCWLADQQDGGDVNVFIGLSAESTGPLQGANWVHSGHNGWKEGKPTGAIAFTHLTGLQRPTHNADLLTIITKAITFTYSPLDNCY